MFQDVLGYYPNTSAQIKVFSVLEMKHPLAEGPQRVRCFPFANHTWQADKKKGPHSGRKITDPVFIKPLQAQEDFSLPDDASLLHYGRVLLLFSIWIPGRLGNKVEMDLAFIKYYDQYKVQGKSCFQMTIECVLCTHICVLSTQCVFVQKKMTNFKGHIMSGCMFPQKHGMKLCQSTTSWASFLSCQILALPQFHSSTRAENKKGSPRVRQTQVALSMMAASCTTSTTMP
mgnify:CR=1 FL=1